MRLAPLLAFDATHHGRIDIDENVDRGLALQNFAAMLAREFEKIEDLGTKLRRKAVSFHRDIDGERLPQAFIVVQRFGELCNPVGSALLLALHRLEIARYARKELVFDASRRARVLRGISVGVLRKS